jgi:PAT family beta-lactamase induction signal transducer AmpG
MLRAVAADAAGKLGTWRSLRAVAGSRRLLSVALLSFSSGLPLGLVWIAIPAWLTRAGVDIKVVGLFTLAQAPWTFKFLWSPLMDRYALPLLGRKRGWLLLAQAGLCALGLWLAGVSDHPEAVWVIGSLTLAIALAAATQDIAYDAYAVEVLRREEQGMAVGARVALYRAAMYLSSGLAITYAAQTSWALVNLLLALAYVPCMLVTVWAPEPERPPAPVRTLKEAVWGPFLGFLSQHRALEILCFVLLYKLSDQLTQALMRPFFIKVGFDDFHVGLGTTTVGVVAMLAGTFLGGILTDRLGLGRSLWIFGFLQIFSNLGYAVLAQVGPSPTALYLSLAFEMGTSGLGSGAFGVLLLRLTQKRFSATQYALLSSLFSVSRVLAGPPAAVLADALGWRDFFIMTVFTGIPGMLMLARFLPWGMREPEFVVAPPAERRPLGRGALISRALGAGAAAWALGLALMAAVSATKGWREGRGFDLAGQALGFAWPATLGQAITAAGIGTLAVLAALTTAAALAARRGTPPPPLAPE